MIKRSYLFPFLLFLSAVTSTSITLHKFQKFKTNETADYKKFNLNENNSPKQKIINLIKTISHIKKKLSKKGKYLKKLKQEGFDSKKIEKVEHEIKRLSFKLEYIHKEWSIKNKSVKLIKVSALKNTIY